MGSDTLPAISDGLLFIDLETRNRVDLKKVGTDVYARSAEIILASVAGSEGPASLWQLGQDDKPIRQLLRHPNVKVRVAHNAFFERVVLRCTGWYAAGPDKWHCTMAQAYAHAMPGDLGQLCKFLGLPESEQKKGDRTRLINLFCKPRRDGSWATAETDPGAWQDFMAYSLQDTVAMRAAFKAMATLNLGPFSPLVERKLWVLDQKINDTGLRIDLPLAQAALEACQADKKRLDAMVSKITKGTITSATQRERVLKQLHAYGVNLPDLRAATVEKAASDSELRGEIRALIDARLQVSKASTGKYTRLLAQTGPDGRLRNTFQFAGAKRTGRWAGRSFQPHNLPRPKRKQPAIEAGIRALKAGCADLIDDVHSLCSDTLRSVVIPADGHMLRVADFNAIEGRKLAWLANETWKLKIYADPEADMYPMSYRRVMGLPDDYQLAGDMRQQGKVFELSLGYEGGVEALINGAKTYRADPAAIGEGAWRAAPPEIRERAHASYQFAIENGSESMKELAAKLGRKLYTQLDAAKLMWRAASPATCRLWKLYKEAALKAVKAPGTKFQACRCVFIVKHDVLFCRLPSGRFLLYHKPRIQNGVLTHAAEFGGRQSMYGGKWAENITQAVSRDRLAHSMLEADAEGFQIIMHVHDEIVAETPVDSRLDLAKLLAVMSRNPPWAQDCPIKIAGYEADRYRKD